MCVLPFKMKTKLPPIVMTIEFRVVTAFWERSPIVSKTCDCLVLVLRSIPNHTPNFKYRCLIKKNDQTRLAYLVICTLSKA